MEDSPSEYKVHVFVCTNDKKSSNCCGLLGAEDLRKALKDWSKEKPEWRKKIRINNAGCLDRCSEGIAVAIYPQNKWFVNARTKDLDTLKAEITRLMEEA